MFVSLFVYVYICQCIPLMTTWSGRHPVLIPLSELIGVSLLCFQSFAYRRLELKKKVGFDSMFFKN